MFEAAGAAACQVTDAWEGIEDFFAPGAEILVAGGPEDVVRHVREVDPARAREIGRAARRRALADHTYGARARVLDGVLRGAAEAVA
jgi:spore maturation protein CgeB